MQEEWTQESVPVSNWVRFVNVGDSVIGTFVSRSFKQGQGGFPDQEVFEIDNVTLNGKKEEGIWYLGIKANNKFLMSRLSRMEKGRRFGVKFTKVIPAKQKGHHDAKSLEPHIWGFDEAYKVKEEFSKPEDNIPFN